MLKCGQKEVKAKDFYKERQTTNIFTIDVNKLVVSEKVSCNSGKDCRYTVGYQVDGTLIPLSTGHLKIYLVMVCQNMTKALSIQCHLVFFRQMSGCLSTKRFGMRLGHSCLIN